MIKAHIQFSHWNGLYIAKEKDKTNDIQRSIYRGRFSV